MCVCVDTYVVFHTVYVLIIKKDIIKKDINEGTKTAQGPSRQISGSINHYFVSQEKDSSTKKLSAGGGAKKKYRANQLLF